MQAGLDGLGVFVLCGTWTSADGETGVVPKNVAGQHGSAESIAALLEAGLWTDVGGGYRMEYGPRLAVAALAVRRRPKHRSR